MHFQVIRVSSPMATKFHWQLIKADGPVCESIGGFKTESAARSDIAAVKKSMKGAYRCAVRSPGYIEAETIEAEIIESAGRNNPEGGEN